MTRQPDFDTTTYRDYLPPLGKATRAQLAEAIEADGCRDPLVVGVVLGNRFLIDGFNRFDICTDIGADYRTVDVAFACEDDLLGWIERNSAGRRSETRTTRNYYIGCRYLREKKAEGGDGSNQHKGGATGQSLPSCSTAERIARETGCSPRHVKNCADLVDHIARACAAGLDCLKWPILLERVRYNEKLLDRLIELGGAHCRGPIEALLGESPDLVSLNAIRKAVGEPLPERKKGDSRLACDELPQPQPPPPPTEPALLSPGGALGDLFDNLSAPPSVGKLQLDVEPDDDPTLIAEAACYAVLEAAEKATSADKIRSMINIYLGCVSNLQGILKALEGDN